MRTFGGDGAWSGHAARLPLAALAIVILLGILLAGWAGGLGMMSGDHMGAMGAMHRGADTSGSAAIQGGIQATVEMRDTSFRPGNLVVPVGTTVTWLNRDSIPHDAASLDGSWATPILSKGETATVVFEAAGVYDYHCRIHPSMRARLTVVAATAGG